MSAVDESAVKRRARGHIARRRGALIGVILIVLGAWGALIPFIGPYFHYAYTPNHAWHRTASRGWLEVLPGAVTALGGLMVMISNSRTAAVLGAWLAVAGGAWFAIGPSFEPILHIGAVGTPAGSDTTLRTLEAIGFFYGLGVVIVFFAATASGRLSVRSLADIHHARRVLDQEAEARIRERGEHTETAATRGEVSDIEGREESQEQADRQLVPADRERQPAAAPSVPATDTTGSQQPESYPPPDSSPAMAEGVEPADAQPDQRARR